MSGERQFIDIAKNKIKGLTTSNYMTSPNIWMKVNQVMTKDVATIGPSETVARAAMMMSERNISCIIITDNEEIVGILTETDLLNKTVVKGQDTRKIRVTEIMSSPVETAPSDLSVLDAGAMMEAKHIKRLPILDEGKLAGIVTQTDLTHVITSYGMWREVSEIMSQDVAVIQRDTTIAQAAEIMSSQKISSIVVMDKDNIAGVITERDLLKRVVAVNRNPVNTKAEEIMSSPVYSIPSNYSVFSASRTMENMNVRRLVVVENEKIRGIVTQTDIFRTVKKKIQTEEETILKFMDESKIGFYMIDLNHNVTYVNPAFMRLFEVSEPKDLINHEFLPERFWVEPEERSQFLNDLSNEFVKSRELSLKTCNEKKIYIAILSSFTIGIHGEINGYQGIVYDITEKKEFSELKEAEEKQNELIKRIGKINKELNDFAYIVSHDLKAPLRGIKTITEWIIEDYADKLDESGKKNLDLLTSQVDHMYSLIDGILKYSRAVNAKGEKEKIDLNDLIPTIVDMVSVPNHIEMIVDDNLPVITYERTQITQVFQNLLSNAVKYMDKPEGKIRVGFVEEEETWKFSISDNGPGIPKKYHEKVFEIFQTLKPSGEFESTGVGLTLVKKIVENCGGTVWIESELGQGSTFLFTVLKQNSMNDEEILEATMVV